MEIWDVFALGLIALFILSALFVADMWSPERQLEISPPHSFGEYSLHEANMIAHAVVAAFSIMELHDWQWKLHDRAERDVSHWLTVDNPITGVKILMEFPFGSTFKMNGTDLTNDIMDRISSANHHSRKKL